jgi:hypothetical protein
VVQVVVVRIGGRGVSGTGGGSTDRRRTRSGTGGGGGLASFFFLVDCTLLRIRFIIHLLFYHNSKANSA